MTETHWYRARADVSLSSVSFGMDGEPTFHPRCHPYVTIYVDQYRVAKHTPCGVRLENGRFINRSARKRWACPTKEEAIESLKARYQRRRQILKAQLKSTEAALEYLTCSPQQSDTNSTSAFLPSRMKLT